MEEKETNPTAPKTAIVRPLAGAVEFAAVIPGSKSLANRALILAAAARGESVLTGLPDNDDVRAAVVALAALGVGFDSPAPGVRRVRGTGGAFPVRRGDVEIGSAGTVGRFLPGFLAASGGGRWRLLSSPQLARRPLEPLLDGLRAWGADVRPENPGYSFPLAINGAGLDGGLVRVSVKDSSQFASGLLMCAPLCRRGAVVTVEDVDPRESYLDATLDAMRTFGARAEPPAPEGDGVLTVRIDAPVSYRAADVEIEADLNSAMYFLVLPLLVGGRATVTNASADSRQPGARFLEIIARLGGRVRSGPDGLTVQGTGARLAGGFEVDMRAMSEMAPTLAALAVFADRPVTMTNLAHIRNHETDRLAAIAEILAGIGVRAETGGDWIRVHPAERPLPPDAIVDSRDDHRLAMAAALIGLAGNGLTIANADAVTKTLPDFFARLQDITPA